MKARKRQGKDSEGQNQSYRDRESPEPPLATLYLTNRNCGWVCVTPELRLVSHSVSACTTPALNTLQNIGFTRLSASRIAMAQTVGYLVLLTSITFFRLRRYTYQRNLTS